MENKSYGLWLGVIGGVILILLGLMYLVRNMPGPDTSVKIPEVTADDWQEGAGNLPVTLVEYSDFQCPACALYYPLVKRVKTDFASTTRFVYRHFPLPQHVHAKTAAYAAEAAGLQGKFFEMHDVLFEKQKEWENDADPTQKFVSYAETIGLDIARFNTDRTSDAVKKKVDEAESRARTIGIPATPTFFVNGKQVANPNGYDEFKALLDAALKNG